MSLDIAKKTARKAASSARRAAAAAAGGEAAALFAENFARHVPVSGDAVVSGYLPIGSELDVRRALNGALKAGAEICLPAVIAEAAPLVFRRWRDGDVLVEEAFGTMAPAADAAVCEPTVLIVPMLAFDRAGYRLGYGGGFYDRTLAALRAKGPVLAVGAAFADQEVKTVPHDDLDQPLDLIVTERAAIRIQQ